MWLRSHEPLEDVIFPVVDHEERYRESFVSRCPCACGEYSAAPSPTIETTDARSIPSEKPTAAGMPQPSVATFASLVIWNTERAALHQGHYRRCRGERSALSAQRTEFDRPVTTPLVAGREMATRPPRPWALCARPWCNAANFDSI